VIEWGAVEIYNGIQVESQRRDAAQENGVDSVSKREEIVVVLEVECILGEDTHACFYVSTRNILIFILESEYLGSNLHLATSPQETV
jgi:hypothetical protein